jgi:hypothetical protein
MAEPRPGDDPQFKRRAPALYFIIAVKLLKGSLFVTFAIIAYALSDDDLSAELRHALHLLRLNPERRFWADLATQLGRLT